MTSFPRLSDLLATRALLEREVAAQRRRERAHAAETTTATVRLTRLQRVARDARRSAEAALMDVERRVRDARGRRARDALAAATRIPAAVLDARVFPACDIDARLALGVSPRRWWTTPAERAAFEASPRCAPVARFARLNSQRKIYPDTVRLPIWYDDDTDYRRRPDDDDAARAFIYVFQETRGDRVQGYLCSTYVKTYSGPSYLHYQQLPYHVHRDQFRGKVKFLAPY